MLWSLLSDLTFLLDCKLQYMQETVMTLSMITILPVARTQEVAQLCI